MRGRAFVGTSGFAYVGWVPRFYPEGTRSKNMLRAYAGRLPSVESNYTFNALPSEKMLAAWVDATPPEFRFALKASRRITHDTQLRDTTDSLPRFLERASLLRGRLGVVLYQTPPWLRRDDELLRRFLAALPPSPRAAFEFRHESWYDEAVFASLRGRNAALVTAEGEKAPAPYTVTADFVYARLRRRARYGDDALGVWAARFGEALSAGRDVYAYLWHDDDGENALAARRLLERLA